jgi:pSer/pThr/pTyr-binding forkhead associated (FHA) protein
MTLTLVLFKSSGGRKEIPLNRPKTIIGRRPECHIRIPKAEISRQHCQIFREGQTYKVKDLGSSNGTFLNSEKVLEAVINAGDQLSVGHTTFTVLINGMPQSYESPPATISSPPKQPAKAEPLENKQKSQGSSIDDAVAELLDFDEDDLDDDDIEPLDELNGLDPK